VITMIPYAEPLLDQRRNALSSPQLCAIPMRHSALRKKHYQLCLLLQRKTWWSARGGLGLQCSATAAAPCITPSKYTAGMASDAACNIMQREVLSQQGYHTAPSILQVLGRTVWPHGGAPFRNGSIILHYLCGGQ
jgi:hypothetical protein